jgi:uncharacterized protein YceK
MRKLKLICIFIIAFVLVGCGTAITKAGGDIGNTYSGTEFDKNWISCLSSGLTHPNNDIISKFIVLVFMAYPIADLPFSFAADTIFFPIDKVSDEKIEDPDYSFCGLIEEFSG